MARDVQRVLLVEDDAKLRRAIRRSIRSDARVIVEVSSCKAALAALEGSSFDMVLLDVHLPDGSGLQVADAAAACSPVPLIVVLSGDASAGEAFRLAQLGAIHYLPKPFSVEQLHAAMELAHDTRVKLEPIVRSYVGKAKLYEVQDSVRRAMVDQALAITKGNRSAAARLLRVTRQAIQKFIRAAE